MFRGSFTAIVTPFRNGEVDKPAFDALVERQIEAGSHGIVACGTTGESPTLTHEDHVYIVERSVHLVKRRIPVIAGTGSNSTAKTIDLTRHAKKAGADAALIVTPYYNKPTQDGLYEHYKAVAEAVDIPIIVYNIPGRCVVDVKTETLARMAKIPNIVGVKDATSDMARPAQVAKMIGPDFIQLSGEDASVIDFMEQGGHGCISVTANVAPTLCAEMHRHWQKGEKKEARAINERLMPLHKALFTETSPQPVKYALSALGLCTDEMCLPLLPASPAARKAVDEALKKTGLVAENGAKPLRSHG